MYKAKSDLRHIATSKMELFMAIGICKVIFYKLMIFVHTVFPNECLLCQLVTGSIPFQVVPPAKI